MGKLSCKCSVRMVSHTHLLASWAVSVVHRPLDFVGTFSNRWSYGVAFGATANKVMFLFSEGNQLPQVPQWAQGTKVTSHLLGMSPWKFLLLETTGFSGIRGKRCETCQWSLLQFRSCQSSQFPLMGYKPKWSNMYWCLVSILRKYKLNLKWYITTH